MRSYRLGCHEPKSQMFRCFVQVTRIVRIASSLDSSATVARTFAAVVFRSETHVDKGASADRENLWMYTSSVGTTAEIDESSRPANRASNIYAPKLTETIRVTHGFVSHGSGPMRLYSMLVPSPTDARWCNVDTVRPCRNHHPCTAISVGARRVRTAPDSSLIISRRTFRW